MTRSKFLLSIPYLKLFQLLCIAQRIKSQILNMTHEILYNQAFTVSLASSPKHVVLKFFPLIMFPLLQVTAQTCYFLSLTLGMLLSPHTLSSQAYLTLGKVLVLFYYSLGTTLIPASLYPQDHTDP